MTEDLFRVAVTAIIKRVDGKFLITKRTANKKRWPNKWTVPGGNVETGDFLGKPTEIDNQWYHTLENAVYREVWEEVGLAVSGIKYLCNIAVPGCIIVSFVARLTSPFDLGIPTLQPDECDDYAWVTYEEAKNYDLIDGLLDELKLAQDI